MKDATGFPLEQLPDRTEELRLFSLGERAEFYLKCKGVRLWHDHNTFLNRAFPAGIQVLAFFVFLFYKLLRYSYEKAQVENSSLRRLYLRGTFMTAIVPVSPIFRRILTRMPRPGFFGSYQGQRLP